MFAISATEIDTFQRCKRMWNITSPNRYGLETKIKVSSALELGSLIHKTLADWLVNPDKDPETFYNLHSLQAVFVARENYKSAVGYYPSSDELEVITSAVELGKRMIQNYRNFYSSPLPNNFRFCAPEQEVQIPIEVNGIKCTCHNSVECTFCEGTGYVKFALKCTLDGLVQDDAGQVYILEHKTYGQHPNADILNRNGQFLKYIWALGKLEIGPVGGLLYDGMWKREAPGKTGKYTKMSDLFTRCVITRTNSELTELEEELKYIALEMYKLSIAEKPEIIGASPQFPKTVPWSGCTDCTIASKLCNAISLNEDIRYTQQRLYQARVFEEPMQ